MHLSAPPRLAGRLSTPEVIVGEAVAGGICVLVHGDADGLQGELVVPADAATPDVINFMARYGRGIVSLALTRARVEQLRLPLMAAFDETGRKSPAAMSIEARTGVTTGISTADRARTIAVAIDPLAGANDIVTPGHVFPLVARDGGLLIRRGFAEAAIDLARLAGRNPSGVMCPVLDDTGMVAGIETLEALCDEHGLCIGSIDGLVAHLRRSKPIIQRAAERTIDAMGACWRGIAYRASDGLEHVALALGDISSTVPLHVHVHARSPVADLISETRVQGLHRAMREMADVGRGVVIMLGGAVGLAVEAYGFGEFGVEDHARAAQILADLRCGANGGGTLVFTPETGPFGMRLFRAL